MALTNSYLVTTKNLEGFLNAIKSAKAPDKFTNTFLKQLDYSSSNDRLFVGVLKGLGLLDESGTPTQRYFAFLDQGESGKILAEGIKDAYEDLYAVNKRAHTMSVEEVKNKLRTLTQGQKSDKVLGLMANTFKALSDIADWGSPTPAIKEAPPPANKEEIPLKQERNLDHSDNKPLNLNYNIQIHLPESRDPAVFDAIFQALRKHLI
jgi:hypothetical protein